MGIVSNIDEDSLHPLLRRAGLEDVLGAWTRSEEAGSCKPDAAIFHLALRKAGCRPEQGLFIGDSPEQDVAGAPPLGMTPVRIQEPSTSPPGSGTGEAAEPHPVIESLAQRVPLLTGPLGTP